MIPEVVNTTTIHDIEKIPIIVGEFIVRHLSGYSPDIDIYINEKNQIIASFVVSVLFIAGITFVLKCIYLLLKFTLIVTKKTYSFTKHSVFTVVSQPVNKKQTNREKEKIEKTRREILTVPTTLPPPRPITEEEEED
jgi:hypothetical protein